MTEVLERGPNAEQGLGRIQSLLRLAKAVENPADLLAIFDKALDCLSETSATERCSLLLADENRVMRFRAWRGLSEEYRKAVDGHSPWAPEDSGATPILVPDVQEDRSLSELLPVLEREGIRAVAFIPVFEAQRLAGKFMLYYGEPHSFTERELITAQLVSSYIGFALERETAREREEHLQGVFNSTIAGVAELDTSGRFLEVNDAFCRIVGYSREQLVENRDCYAITHPEDRDTTRGWIDGLMAGGSSFTIEKRYVRPDGQLVWVSKSVSPLHDAEGRVTSAIAVVLDVTERVRIERLRAESERKYRRLVESLGLAVYTTDAGGYITLYNREAVELWGREPVLGVDRWCGSYRIYDAHGEPMAIEDCPMGIALRENRPVRGVEVIVERPDGVRAHVMPYPTPLHDEDGQLAGALNVLMDISSLKDTEQRLEAALRSKDDFLGQVSHELRNPVAQILGNARLLADRWQTLPAEGRDESVSELYVQSLRVHRLIENMLTLSRLERGVFPEVEPCLLQHLIPTTIAEFRIRYPDADIRVILPPDLPPIDATPSTIDQVLWNYLSNAQKYGRPAGPIVVLAEATSLKVEVRVLDEGPGVAESDIPSLFQPYFRAPGTPEYAAGVGLGLSVCRRLLESQGGRVWARRREAGGMEFGMVFQACAELEYAQAI